MSFKIAMFTKSSGFGNWYTKPDYFTNKGHYIHYAKDKGAMLTGAQDMSLSHLNVLKGDK